MKIKITSDKLQVHTLPITKGISRKMLSLAELTPVLNIGDPKEYLSDVLGKTEVDKLEPGHSMIVSTEVGTGKSTAILKIAAVTNHTCFFIITNRKCSLIQMKREYLKLIGQNVSGWDDEAVLGYDTGNIAFITYQKLAQKGSAYCFPEGSTVVLDEIHYIHSDAMFSHEPMVVMNIIRRSRENTKRIYISATMDEVLDDIIMLEKKSEIAKTVDEVFRNTESAQINETNIDQIYLMDSSWEHLRFKYYSYSDTDMLAEMLNENSANGNKAIVFIRSKKRGEKLKENLNDSDMVFAADENMTTLTEITRDAEYSSGTVLATNVLENGVSIVDPKVNIIVIDEIDQTAFRQFLGRIRNSRANPRKLTVIVPDYSLSELTQFQRSCYDRIQLIHRVIENPEYCMANHRTYAPYVYFDLMAKVPVPNYLALKKFNSLYEFTDRLIEEEKSIPTHISAVSSDC